MGALVEGVVLYPACLFLQVLIDFQGLGVSMSRSCVVNAIFFTAFELSKKRINRLSVDDELLRELGK